MKVASSSFRSGSRAAAVLTAACPLCTTAVPQFHNNQSWGPGRPVEVSLGDCAATRAALQPAGPCNTNLPWPSLFPTGRELPGSVVSKQTRRKFSHERKVLFHSERVENPGKVRNCSGEAQDAIECCSRPGLRLPAGVGSTGPGRRAELWILPESVSRPQGSASLRDLPLPAGVGPGATKLGGAGQPRWKRCLGKPARGRAQNHYSLRHLQISTIQPAPTCGSPSML
jgi:hypothetical protein